jgi:hypothetical protein
MNLCEVGLINKDGYVPAQMSDRGAEYPNRTGQSWDCFGPKPCCRWFSQLHQIPSRYSGLVAVDVVAFQSNVDLEPIQPTQRITL